MKTRKIVVLLLVVCLLAISCFALAACDKDKSKDKAIIYVTALFAGGLYDKQTGEAKWEPFNTEVDAAKVMAGEIPISELMNIFSDEMPDILDLVDSALSYERGTLLWDLTLDNDGNGYNPNVVPANDLKKYMDIDYGVFGIYRNFIDNISAKYGGDYDVFVYNQDWRISPAKSAEELENYINRKGYKEVVFMSHSMGAPVVNNYLARNQQNRDKVKLYMGFAPATLGSFDALAALACPDTYVDKFLEGMDLGNTVETIKRVVRNKLAGQLGDFFRNNQGLMSLVPSWQLVSSAQYDEERPAITVDGKAISSKDELYSLYSSMRWAKYLTPKSQAEQESADYDGKLYSRVLAQEGQAKDSDGYRIKDFAANLANYFDNMFIDGKIASEQINSYYFLGTGMANTITGMSLTTRKDSSGNVLYDDYGCVLYDYQLLSGGYGAEEKLGDGTVPYYSSIGGNTATEEFITSLGDRLVELDSQNHGMVGVSWDLLGTYVMNLLEQYI